MTDPVADDGTASGSAPAVPFITRVRLKNYKSIASCDVRLGPLTILIGPNGSGKSNFLDALAFLSRALRTTVDEAIDERGGLRQVLCRVPDQAESFTIAVEAVFSRGLSEPGLTAAYEMEIGQGKSGSGFEVIHEECVLRGDGITWRFRREGSRVVAATNLRMVGGIVDQAGLFLQHVGFSPFGQLHAGLSRLRFYNFNPALLRAPLPSKKRPVMESTGEGVGDIIVSLESGDGYYKRRIDTYIDAIVQGAVRIEVYPVGSYMAISLITDPDGREVKFDSMSMSDGTIRATAVLAALFQPESLDGRVPLVGIEEPELALHPSAAGVLFGALDEASDHVQVIATSHSADLLDREDLDLLAIRVVTMQDGLTMIGEVDGASRETVKRKLFTLGELMRSDQISPAPVDDGSPEA